MWGMWGWGSLVRGYGVGERGERGMGYGLVEVYGLGLGNELVGEGWSECGREECLRRSMRGVG